MSGTEEEKEKVLIKTSYKELTAIFKELREELGWNQVLGGDVKVVWCAKQTASALITKNLEGKRTIQLSSSLHKNGSLKKLKESILHGMVHLIESRLREFSNKTPHDNIFTEYAN